MIRRSSEGAQSTQLGAVQCAADWLVLLKDQTVSRRDRETFVAWLRQSPLHVEEFLRVSSLDAALFGRDLGFDPRQLLAAAGEDAHVHVLRHDVQPRTRPRRAWRSRRWLATAAVAALSAIVCTPLALRWLSAPAAYSTERGEQRSVSLPDGSLMELNTETSVQVLYGERERRIRLSGGEALFSVARNPSRPFVVEAGNHSVQATGTRFSVAETAARIVVTVVEGSVAVKTVSRSAGARAPKGRSWDLSAGEQFDSIAPATARVRTVDPERATAWQQWKLYFDNASLADVVSEFNRYNQHQLQIADRELAERRISGMFFANQPDSLIAFIDERDPVEVVEARGGVRVIHLR